MLIHYIMFASACFFAFFGCYLKRYSLKYVKDAELLKKQKSIALFWAIVSFSVLIFFLGMRSQDYNDTSSYVAAFNRASYDLSELSVIIKGDSDQKGWDALLLLFKHFVSKDYVIWFFFLAIFQAGAIIKLYYKYSENYFMSIYLFFASCEYTWMCYGIRQFTAVCFVLYFFEWIVKKKYIKMIIVILLAYTIHASCIFWLPVLFIVNFKPFSSKIWVCVILTVLAVVFIEQFTDFLDSATEGTDLEGSGTQLVNYGDGTDDGVNIIRVLVAAVPPAIAYYRKDVLFAENNKTIYIFVNMATVATGLYLLGTVTSGILVGRMPVYFMMTNYILLPWVLNRAFVGKRRTLIILACYALYFCYYLYAMVISHHTMYGSERLGLFYY